jgi:Ca-activated chloride channel homolog
MAQKFDPYVILGVAASASDDEIKRAYTRLIKRIQPDTNQYAATAVAQLEIITSAYNLLMDSNQRRNYDSAAKKTDDKSDLYFSMRVTSSKRAIIPLPEDQIIYLLVDIIASPAARKLEEREANLNLTLIIDHSKSMDDENRMDKVKAAAQAIITELTHEDAVSIVAFNDWSSVIIPAAHVQDKMSMRGRVSMIQPKGGTEIFKGLAEGVKQNRKFLDPNMINHMILLTDGRTYGDEKQCLDLAQQIVSDGISISAMGLGSDWNDQFLDQLAALTGGTSTYIKSVSDVPSFLDDRIRNLSNAFAERVQLAVVPEPGVQLEMAFQLSPSPQPLTHENGIIHLASLQPKRPISVLLQFLLPAQMPEGTTSVARLVTTGDIMPRKAHKHTAIGELEIQVTKNPGQMEGPPASIIDALSKLTLYQMQEKAHAALERGDIAQATQQLQFLGTRLIDMGEVELGRQALSEAQHISQTRAFSNDASSKTIKYSTRALIQPGAMKEALTAMFTDEDDQTASPR